MLYLLTRFVLRPLVLLFFAKRLTGLDHLPTKGPYLLVANHTSFFDHFILNALISKYRGERLYILTKSEAFERPLSAWWHRQMGAIPLDRKRPDPAAIRATLNSMKDGRIVAIFPEGTRSLTGCLGTGKLGIIKLAAMAGVPIIPVGMRGVFEALPPGQKIPRLRPIEVHIGAPLVFTTGLRGKQLEAAGQSMMQAIASLAGQPPPESEDAEPDEGEHWTKDATWCFERAHQDRNTRKETLFWLKRAHYAASGAIKKAPESARAWWIYGRVIGFLGIQVGIPRGISLAIQSRRAMEKAMLLDPTYAYPYYGLGLWYEKMPRLLGGGKAASKVFYERAAKLAPREIFVQLAYARVCSDVGLTEEAQNILRHAINCAPGSYEDQRRLRTAATLLEGLDPDMTMKIFLFDRANRHPRKDHFQHV